jgi:hypothetical protein
MTLGCFMAVVARALLSSFGKGILGLAMVAFTVLLLLLDLFDAILAGLTSDSDWDILIHDLLLPVERLI